MIYIKTLEIEETMNKMSYKELEESLNYIENIQQRNLQKELKWIYDLEHGGYMNRHDWLFNKDQIIEAIERVKNIKKRVRKTLEEKTKTE